MPRTRLALAGFAVSLVAAAAAEAAGEPSVFAAARIGSLNVVSGAVVAPKSVELRGVWTDDTQPCSQTRLLTVRASVDRVPFGGAGARVMRRGTFTTANCAEGGPNTGFTLNAGAIGYGCANGRWKPGIYTFTTISVDHRKRLRAVASVGWENRTPC